MAKLKIKKTIFGHIQGAGDVFLYTLVNENGMSVAVTDYGCILTSLWVPDKKGGVADVVLGFDNLESYLAPQPYFGALIGRFAGRIAGGTFTLDGTVYHLPVNDGAHHLHGGIRGFDKVMWQAQEIRRENEVGVAFTYLSKDGEEGYPGNLSTTATYLLTADNALKIEYRAMIDKPCPVNFTHHSYFNLEGAGGGDTILDHRLTVPAHLYGPVDGELIPYGDLAAVENTAMDFRTPEAVGARIDEVEGGYDHTYLLDDGAGGPRTAAILEAPRSGRIMTVYTTEPGLQFYTGNFLDGTITGKGGRVYGQHDALCLETQHFPDSPNHPEFPSTILRPGEIYSHTVIYAFSTG